MSWIIYSLIIGGLAGYLAGKLLKGSGFGILGNIVIGVFGSVVGGFVFGLLNISLGAGIIGKVITSVIGAILFLFIYGKVREKKSN